jgi:LacI family transcriptional regulator
MPEQVRYVRENFRERFVSKKPTLRDIAEQADVALSTVSQVLNNKPNVSAETRRRVLKVAAEIGYRQKVASNGPLASQLSTVGLLTKSLDGDPLIVNPFYSYIIAGVDRECQRDNIHLMYANMEVDARNHVLNLPAMLLDEVLDGVIIIGALLEETITHISRRVGRNIVLIDAYTSDGVAFDSVLIDNFRGAFAAVSHLIENGHRKIGLIGSCPDSYPSIIERRHGYLAALEHHGITETYIEDSELSRLDAFQATLRLIKRSPEITAIFACNDNVALGVMNALHEAGMVVPRDVSLVGFDDIDCAQEVVPPLTTVHVDKVLIGVMAVRHLRDRAEDPNRPAVKTLISTQLIQRGSVKRRLAPSAGDYS